MSRDGATTSRRVVMVFTDDTAASEALSHALFMLGSGPAYLPYPEGSTAVYRRDNPQPQATEQQRKDWAVEALWAVRGRIHLAAQILVPTDWQEPQR